MDTEFLTPLLGVDIEEGQVRAWLKQVGEPVAVGDLIVVIGTPKLDMEIESPVAGTLKRILLEVDDIAAVGAPLAIIG